MQKKIKIVLAQLNLHVGDLDFNTARLKDAAKKAKEKYHADLIVFPELAITGYPPEDLLLRPSFLQAVEKALEELKNEIRDIHFLIGFPKRSSDNKLFNHCALIYNGTTLAECDKINLPNYGVFDEARYFSPGNTKTSCIATIHDIPIGIIICEDLWAEEPVANVVKAGARLIISPNASPFEIGKIEKRKQLLSKLASDHKIALVYTNLVGGQDDLLFDGSSLVYDQDGVLCASAPPFEEKLLLTEIDLQNNYTHIKAKIPVFNLSLVDLIYKGLVLALQDYVYKNNFTKVLIGLSGGIDSALTLAIAVDALGAENVQAVMMPSRFSAAMSLEDAVSLANNLHVTTKVIPIEEMYSATLKSLASSIAHDTTDITKQNIQARIRALILMALSNTFGQLVITTGNRSELAVGYCTLYGDMAGGFALLKDIPKTYVYELAHHRNKLKEVIPARILTREPSAELAPNQKDADTLPPYDILDNILALYIDNLLSIPEIVAQGFDQETVERIVQLIRLNEYKRQQSAPGPRIHDYAFGKDRRYPITNGYKA